MRATVAVPLGAILGVRIEVSHRDALYWAVLFEPAIGRRGVTDVLRRAVPMVE